MFVFLGQFYLEAVVRDVGLGGGTAETFHPKIRPKAL